MNQSQQAKYNTPHNATATQHTVQQNNEINLTWTKKQEQVIQKSQKKKQHNQQIFICIWFSAEKS